MMIDMVISTPFRVQRPHTFLLGYWYLYKRKFRVTPGHNSHALGTQGYIYIVNGWIEDSIN